MPGHIYYKSYEYRIYQNIHTYINGKTSEARINSALAHPATIEYDKYPNSKILMKQLIKGKGMLKRFFF